MVKKYRRHGDKKIIPFRCRKIVIFMGIFRPSKAKDYFIADHTRHGIDPGISPGNAKAYRQPGH
jgi:hypothetical protein